MIRIFILALAGILIGGIIHLVTVLMLPTIASRDAYSRLAQVTPVNSVAALLPALPGTAPLPFLDPAMAQAVCRYDLSQGPIRLTVPVSLSYTSVSFYTDRDVAFYAINDRSAGRKIIELNLMTAEQHGQLPEDEEITAADRLIIDSPSEKGLIVLKALAAEPSLFAQARASLAAAKCTVAPELLKPSS